MGRHIQSIRGKNYQPRIIYLAKLSSKNEGETEVFYQTETESLLPGDLPYKKCKKELLRLK